MTVGPTSTGTEVATDNKWKLSTGLIVTGGTLLASAITLLIFGGDIYANHKSYIPAQTCQVAGQDYRSFCGHNNTGPYAGLFTAGAAVAAGGIVMISWGAVEHKREKASK